MKPVTVARRDDVQAGRPRLVTVEDTRLVITRVGDTVYACADACAHKGGPLSEGKQSGTRLACPWHGWMYDVRTGQCTFPGRGAAVAAYPVRIEAGGIVPELP
ncbi:MAG: Rieske (2Fe-2S) protein [Candidatus Rokubacteria bacterium]|nr:Rieske (2Fe-2S) protein [Candidatus Rokubacteria bacterium]MBI3826094.1 Rieske (2Fe-2S) protein [Candidatus Rokubacteria bacterium]